MDVSSFTKDVIAVLTQHQKTGSTIRIIGEVSSFQQSSRGHWFFNLKDLKKDVFVKCVMWDSDVRRQNTSTLKAGEQIQINGVLNVYRKFTELKIKILDISRKSEDEEGEMHKKLMQLDKQLQNEGVYDIPKKKINAKSIKKIGIITSKTGAAIKDFIRVVKSRTNYVEIFVFDTRVQGNVSLQIANAIALVDNMGMDVIVLTRGGGDNQDLWCFNEKPVVMALSRCKTPTVTGIGHATDHTLSDKVSDMAVATPTEAAMRVTINTADELKHTMLSVKMLEQDIKQIRSEEKYRLKHILTSLLNDKKTKMTVVKDGKQELDALMRLRLEMNKYGDGWKLFCNGIQIDKDNVSDIKNNDSIILRRDNTEFSCNIQNVRHSCLRTNYLSWDERKTKPLDIDVQLTPQLFKMELKRFRTPEYLIYTELKSIISMFGKWYDWSTWYHAKNHERQVKTLNSLEYYQYLSNISSVPLDEAIYYVKCLLHSVGEVEGSNTSQFQKNLLYKTHKLSKFNECVKSLSVEKITIEYIN